MSPGLVPSEAERPCREHDLICNFINQRFPTLLLGLPAPLGVGLFGFLVLPGWFWVTPLVSAPQCENRNVPVGSCPGTPWVSGRECGEGWAGGKCAEVNK